MKLSAAGNTEVPAYLSLKALGYKVDNQENTKYWIATKDSTELVAEGPLELLALVKLLEVRGTNWKASDSEIDAFLENYG